MTAGLVSVIIPSYNGEEFLEAALKSVQWQTYQYWECILVDDGSTDDTALVFASFAKTDSRFRYHRKENAGPAAARNTGIEFAQGEFIQFLDDDDILLEERLERCLHEFRLHPEAEIVNSEYVCYSNSEGFYRSLPSRIPDGDTFIAFLCDQNRTFATPVHSFLFKKEIIESNKFDTSLGSHAEDVECWVRIAESGARFQSFDDVQVIYRFTRDSLTQDEAKLLATKVTVLNRYVNHPKVILHHDHFRDAMNYFQEHYAIGCFMKRDFRNGLKAMREQFPDSSWKGRIKMIGWFVSMIFVSRRTVEATRAWIVSHTPFKWGGWKYYRRWTPPESVRRLMLS
ncbi:glycosyltransferase family 2 protein [Sphingobacteriales bacterium CHB3]|nr:glycosyltransferase family 2 protein [Sphingobacteriales bacterium CHB3]